MPFIIKGKTNWRYILIVVVLTTVVAGGFLWFIEQQKDKTITPTQSPEVMKQEVEKQDETICEKMTKETNRNSCYRDIALAKDNETFCENISIETTKWPKTYCYIQIAEKRNEDIVCEGLLDEGERNICYERFARDQINKNSCRKITYLETRDSCYVWFALTQRDSSICEEVEDSFRQIDCKEHFTFNTLGWEIYTNTEYGFEFKIPPLFVQTGYEIIERDKESQSSWLDGKCSIILFYLRPIEPYWGTMDKNEFHFMFPLWICPQVYCQIEEGVRSCKALREGRRELEDGELIWTFCDFVAENENLIIYEQGGPSSGDFADAAGWDKEEVHKIKYQMLSTFKFLE